VGLILPARQIVTEPLYYRIAPPGVAFFSSRILSRGNVLIDHEEREKGAFRAGKELAAAGVDCLVYCCTASGILQGIEGNLQFCRKMEEETGIPTTSTLSSVLEGLDALGLKKIVLVSPYRKETHIAEERFFQTIGFKVVKSRSMDVDAGIKTAMVLPSDIYRFCRKNWDEDAEGLFISCMNFNAMPCIDPLERDLGKPVVSSHSATLRKVLSMIRVREPIKGFGRLLAEV
jgi:maleate isomerase